MSARLAAVILVGFVGVCCSELRIIGGAASHVERFPFMAQMLVNLHRDGHFQQLCAGNILTTRHLLSAAHCYQYNKITGVDRTQPQHWKVRVGSSYRSYGGAIFNVWKIVNHPGFNESSNYNNDIAVVVLPIHIDFGPTVRQATIPVQGFVVPDDSIGLVAGWGAVKPFGEPSEQLMKATLRTINQNVCVERYKSASFNLTDAMMCGGIIETGKVDGCLGDSGGPMIVDGVIVGLISFGYSCGHPHYPGVYTRVSVFTDWVVATVSSNQ